MMAAILSHKSAYFLGIVLLGFISLSARCEARAVNVSNTWTMPQEGLNVFYRFFRDRISWFEADAVCQFHHANLVTVDNSFQFDATRDLLRELDVNDIVWIGLMRPQNGDRFMWSNSRPLIADTGYWAESLPLMDAPLCAVIDPIRDYRWHALRCGGPETASFLCEMPVPSWADACILRDMPNLTMQYMADTASIELIRNCEEEGLIRQSCKSKQDRERVIRELICPRERLEAQRINDITNSHFKSLQIINSIRTDNNENNDIELLPLGQNYESNRDFVEEVQTEKNTVQRLIEQFNVDELMQADEPLGMNNGFIIPGEIPKPVKKTAKKVIITADGEYPPKKEKLRKYQQQKIKKPQTVALEDMMMGDQPMQQAGEPEIPEPHSIDDDVSNEIMERLPHKKKILPQDLRTMPTITEQLPKNEHFIATSDGTIESSTIIPTSMATTTATTSTSSITTHASAHTSVNVASVSKPSMAPMVVEVEHNLHTSTLPAFAETTTIVHTTGLPIVATVGHPIHPQQPHTDIVTEETHEHVKESIDNSHFIPPLLMVKSHYVPPTKHGDGENVEQMKHQHHPHERKMENLNGLELSTSTSTNVESTTPDVTHAKMIKPPLFQTNINADLNEHKINQTEAKKIHFDSTTTTTTTTTTTAEIIQSTIKPIRNIEPKEINIDTKPIAERVATNNDLTTEEQTTMKVMETTTLQQPTTNVAYTISPTATEMTTTKESKDVEQSQTATTTTTTTSGGSTDTKKETSPTSTAVITTLATSQPIATISGTFAADTDTATTITPTSAQVITTTSSPAPVTTSTVATPIMMTTITTTDAPLTSTHNFLKEDTETPFKPNRRRSLTKPEAVSYFKKILG